MSNRPTPAPLLLLLLISACLAAGNAEAPVVLPALHVTADNYIINLDEDGGGHLLRAVYGEVFPRSSLWKHGVRTGDQILTIDSRPISSYSADEFRTLILSGLRSGRKKVFTIKPGHRDLLFRRKPYEITFTPATSPQE